MAKTKGDGSIRSKGRGVWEVRVAFGKDPVTGKYRSVSRTVHGTKRDAAKVRDELRKQHDNGLTYDGSKMTFDDFARNVWYAERLEESIKTNGEKPAKTTLADNLTIINAVSSYIGSVRLSSIDNFMIDSLFKQINKDRDKPLSGARLKKFYCVLNGIFKKASKYHLVNRNPMQDVDCPTCEHHERHTLTSDEVRSLKNSLNNAEAEAYAKLDSLEAGRNERSCPDLRKRITGIDDISRIIAVKIAVESGARRGEILALRWEAVNFETRTVHILKSLTVSGDRKKPKTEKGIRSIRIHDETFWNCLKTWKDKQCQYLSSISVEQDDKTPVVCNSIGGHISTSNFSRWWASHRDNLGCVGLRFHELRHTQASLLIAEKVPITTISERLGHAKVSTTLDFYGHSNEEEDKKAADAFAKITSPLQVVA